MDCRREDTDTRDFPRKRHESLHPRAESRMYKVTGLGGGRARLPNHADGSEIPNPPIPLGDPDVEGAKQTMMFFTGAVVRELEPALQSPEGLLRHRLLDPTSRDSDSVDPGWCLRMCVSNKFPGNAEALSQQPY